MIRPLRKRHRVMVLSLTIALPAAFAVGIATRQEVPVAKAGALGRGPQVHNQSEIWTRNDLWEKNSIQTRLLRTGPGLGQLAVELSGMDRIVRPDVLVYWVPGEKKAGDSLPDDAFLLGSFAPSIATPLTLPESALNQTGALVLYSLADQEIIASSKAFLAR